MVIIYRTSLFFAAFCSYFASIALSKAKKEVVWSAAFAELHNENYSASHLTLQSVGLSAGHMTKSVGQKGREGREREIMKGGGIQRV